MLEALRSWGLSPASLGAAVLVFLLVLIAALWLPEQRKLDDRVRGISGARPRQCAASESAVLHPLRWLATRVPLDRFRQAAMDWFADHAMVGEQKRLVLLQAGFRQPRTYLYFEMSRVLLGIGFAVAGFLALDTFGMFRVNVILALALLFLALMIGLNLPGLYLKRRITARRQAFAEYWDDAIGLLIICLDAGLSIEVAMRRIARELAATAPDLAEEFVITVTDLALLKERRLAYLGLSTRMDLPSVKAVTIALVQAEKQGASIANSLRTIAQTNREVRITTAEEKAAALGPKMTVPMIVFFLPVIFVIIISPIVLTSNL